LLLHLLDDVLVLTVNTCRIVNVLELTLRFGRCHWSITSKREVRTLEVSLCRMTTLIWRFFNLGGAHLSRGVDLADVHGPSVAHSRVLLRVAERELCLSHPGLQFKSRLLLVLWHFARGMCSHCVSGVIWLMNS